MSQLCVIDVGSTTIRVAAVDERLGITDIEVRPAPYETPFPGLVEFDAAAMASAVIDAAETLLARNQGLVGIGIANQRASTVVWDRATGEPIAPALGWQDLRTVMECISAKAEHGFGLAPNQSATKLAWLLDHIEGARDRDVCFGTIDSWLTWVLSGGRCHVTDHSNAGVTGLTVADGTSWHPGVLAALGIPDSVLPAIVPSAHVAGEAVTLAGALPLLGRAGDQQCSLVGQACVRPGLAKITFGTGGMLDMCTGGAPPAAARRLDHGTFPIIAWSTPGGAVWGLEAVMLSAGSNVEWLREDLGLIDHAAASHDLAQTVTGAEGAVYVPALMGLGTPEWDFGARGTLFGLSRGVRAGHIARAVLDGVAHRGVDLIEAAEADSGLPIEQVRIDGGMSRNPTFVQALADLSGRPVEVSPVVEATTRGAGFLAGLAAGIWSTTDDATALWSPARIVEPVAGGRSAERAQWAEAVRRATRWIPELSALDF